MENEVDIKVWQLEGMRCVLVRGELDLYSAKALRAAAALSESTQTLLLDLVGVRYIDSSAVVELLRLRCMAAAAGAELSIHVAEGSAVQRVLRLIQVDRVLSVVAEPAAVPARPKSC